MLGHSRTGFNMPETVTELVGLCRAQKIGNSLYLLVPSDVVARLEIGQGREFEIRYDSQTKAIIYKRKEVAS